MNRGQLQKTFDALPVRTDGGHGFTLDDHILQVRKSRKLGVAPEELAAALGVSVEYVRQVEEHIRTIDN